MYSMVIFLLFLLQLSGRYVDGEENVTHTCNVGIRKERIDEARQMFEEYRNSDMRLVNIYLESTDKVREIFDMNWYELDRNEENGISHWIWASADSLFDLRLPIDIDAATFGMIKLNQLDIDIDLELLDDLGNCTLNTTKMKKELFDILLNNVTINGVYNDGYLCHRFFENQHWKDVYYFFTSGWFGYDFECFSKEKNDKLNSKVVTKSFLTKFVFIIEVMVLLLYPYVFMLIYYEPNDTNFYSKGETPYGINRITRRMFYYKSSSHNLGWELYVPVWRFTVLYCIVSLPFVIKYGQVYQNSIRNYTRYYDIYRFSNRHLYLSFLLFFPLNWLIAFYIKKFPNVIYICGKTSNKEVDFNILSKSKLTNRILRNLVARPSMIFSKLLWKTICFEAFTPSEKGCCFCYTISLLFNIVVIVVQTVLCLLSYLSVIIVAVFSPFLLCCSNYFKFKHSCIVVSLLILFIESSFIFISCLSRILIFTYMLMPVAYVTRIVTYIIFIAIPSLDAASFQIFLIVSAACTYFLNYLNSFLMVYRTLLDTMFEIKKEIEDEKKKLTDKICISNTELPRNERKQDISEEEFDTIEENFFPFGEQLLRLFIKNFLTISGIAIATIVLIDSKRVETFSENLVKLMLIIFSPGVFEKLFVISSEEMVKLKRDEIKKEIKTMEETATEIGSSDQETTKLNKCQWLFRCFTHTFCCYFRKCCNSNESTLCQSLSRKSLERRCCLSDSTETRISMQLVNDTSE